MEKISKIKLMLEYLRDNPKATDEEIIKAIEISPETIRGYKYRLKKRGLLEVNSDKSYKVLKESSNTSYKRELYLEMVEIFMEDFNGTIEIKERIQIGKMILEILNKI